MIGEDLCKLQITLPLECLHVSFSFLPLVTEDSIEFCNNRKHNHAIVIAYVSERFHVIDAVIDVVIDVSLTCH